MGNKSPLGTVQIGQSGTGHINTPMITESERQKETNRTNLETEVIEVHGIRPKPPPIQIKPKEHRRKPSKGIPLSKLQKTDAVFNAFIDQHMDFVKDPNEIKSLQKTKAWA